MHTIRIIFDFALIAIIAYIGVTTYLQYRKEVGTTWQRLLATAKDSATILWSKFCILVAAIAGEMDTIATALGAPQVGDFINTWFGNPKVISGIMLAIALITIKARTRTL